MPVGRHYSTSRKVKNAANDCTANEQISATDAVNHRQDTSRGDEEDDVLNDGRRQGGVSALKVAQLVGGVIFGDSQVPWKKSGSSGARVNNSPCQPY